MKHHNTSSRIFGNKNSEFNNENNYSQSVTKRLLEKYKYNTDTSSKDNIINRKVQKKMIES